MKKNWDQLVFKSISVRNELMTEQAAYKL